MTRQIPPGYGDALDLWLSQLDQDRADWIEATYDPDDQTFMDDHFKLIAV
jgi:hypothetical protein